MSWACHIRRWTPVSEWLQTPLMLRTWKWNLTDRKVVYQDVGERASLPRGSCHCSLLLPHQELGWFKNRGIYEHDTALPMGCSEANQLMMGRLSFFRMLDPIYLKWVSSCFTPNAQLTDFPFQTSGQENGWVPFLWTSFPADKLPRFGKADINHRLWSIYQPETFRGQGLPRSIWWYIQKTSGYSSGWRMETDQEPLVSNLHKCETQGRNECGITLKWT